PGSEASATEPGTHGDGAENPDAGEATTRFQSTHEERTMTLPTGNPPTEPAATKVVPPHAGFTPPPAPSSAQDPRDPAAPPVARRHAIPGYAATIVLGMAVLVFALVVGLHELGMLELPTSAVAIGAAA